MTITQVGLVIDLLATPSLAEGVRYSSLPIQHSQVIPHRTDLPSADGI
jgi:hypothetical protein